MNIFKLIQDIEKADPEVYDRLDSRRSMFKKSGSFAGKLAVAAVPLAMGSMFKKAYGNNSDIIIDVLNFALTLEYLEAKFYANGVASTVIPSSDKAIFQTIAQHEAQHVTFLKAAISGSGGTPVAEPTFDFSGGAGSNNGPFKTYLNDYAIFLTLSQGFEDTGVRAYKGQAGNLISNNDVLTAALQIHSVEARHAAEVRRLRGKKGWITAGHDGEGPTSPLFGIYEGEDNPAQGDVEAYDEPLTKEAVLEIVKPFIKP